MTDQQFIESAPLLPSILLISLYLGGAVYALWSRKRYPKAAILAATGLLALVLEQLLSVWSLFFADVEPGTGESAISLARQLAASIYAAYILQLVGMALLITAVFVSRDSPINRRDA